jgi:hypothetical protein
MTDERKSALALIVGSLAGIFIMALHPTGHDLFAPGKFEAMARMLVAVHALALATLPVLFLGAWGFTRRIAQPDRLAVTALVIYAFGLIALCVAAVADGLLAPAIAREMLGAAPGSSDLWHILFNYNFRVNQAFAQVYVAASSVALFLWSASCLKHGLLSRALAIYGLVLAPLTVLAVFSGHLRLNAHGFGILVLGQTIWFVSVGVLLFNDNPIAA